MSKTFILQSIYLFRLRKYRKSMEFLFHCTQQQYKKMYNEFFAQIDFHWLSKSAVSEIFYCEKKSASKFVINCLNNLNSRHFKQKIKWKDCAQKKEKIRHNSIENHLICCVYCECNQTVILVFISSLAWFLNGCAFSLKGCSVHFFLGLPSRIIIIKRFKILFGFFLSHFRLYAGLI